MSAIAQMKRNSTKRLESVGTRSATWSKNVKAMKSKIGNLSKRTGAKFLLITESEAGSVRVCSAGLPFLERNWKAKVMATAISGSMISSFFIYCD